MADEVPGPSGPQSGKQGPSGPQSGKQGPSGPQSGKQGPSGPEPEDEASGHLGDAVSALLDGELTDVDAEAARSHLAGCPTCEAEMASTGQVRAWVRGLPPVEPPVGFYAAVLAEDSPGASSPGDGVTVVPLSAARRRPRHWQAGVATMAACAAATVVVVGVVAPREPSTPPHLAHFIQAHDAEVGSGDPVSELATAAVPLGFRR